MGLALTIGRKKMHLFNDVKLKVLNKISIYQNKQAIPTFAMSVFKLPMRLCNDIQKVVARFWWGFKKDKMVFIGLDGKE